MRRQLTVTELFDERRERLQLTHVCGDLNRIITVGEGVSSPADIVGHLNLIHPERLQVVGMPEWAWAEKHPHDGLRHQFAKIVTANSPGIIVADGSPITGWLLDVCKTGDLPLFSTPVQAAVVIDSLRSYLSRKFAENTTLHGVFMDVLGIGVLLTGDSGVGKSELGLELISRGHGLVADDVVEVSRISPNALEGRCPELLQNFIEVRGLGLLNIRTVFGETACRRKMRLRLITHLQRPQAGVPQSARLPLDAQEETILGVPVSRVTIPVAAGRNLAVLVETAVRSTILKLRGIDCMQEFLDRQQQALNKKPE
jgi:HPr kinase/phosphorylase